MTAKMMAKLWWMNFSRSMLQRINNEETPLAGETVPDGDAVDAELPAGADPGDDGAERAPDGHQREDARTGLHGGEHSGGVLASVEPASEVLQREGAGVRRQVLARRHHALRRRGRVQAARHPHLGPGHLQPDPLHARPQVRHSPAAPESLAQPQLPGLAGVCAGQGALRVGFQIGQEGNSQQAVQARALRGLRRGGHAHGVCRGVPPEAVVLQSRRRGGQAEERQRRHLHHRAQVHVPQRHLPGQDLRGHPHLPENHHLHHHRRLPALPLQRGHQAARPLDGPQGRPHLLPRPLPPLPRLRLLRQHHQGLLHPELQAHYHPPQQSHSFLHSFIPSFLEPPSLGNYNIEKGVTKLKSATPNDVYADCIGIQVDPDNSLLFAIYSDRTFFIWDIKNFSKVSVKRSFLNHSGPIYDLQVLPLQSSEEVTFFVTASADKTLRIWHFSEELQLQATVDISQIIGIRRNVYCRNLSKIIYISENQKHFKSGQQEDSDDQVKCVKISKDGNFIACGDMNGMLRVYSTSTFQKEYELQGHDSEILTLDFTPQNELGLDFLASGSRDRQIKIYDVQMQFAVILTLDEHTSSITSVKFAYRDKKLILISCSLDRSIIFRELTGAKFAIFHQEQITKIFCMELSHNQEVLYVGLERKVNLYDTLTGKFKQSKDWQKYENHKIILDCSGSYLACQNEDKVLRIREQSTNVIVGSLNQYVSGMAYALSSKHFFTSGFDGCIYIWKMSQEVKNQIDKRKGQLGLMGKRLKEVLHTSKEWTIDSFWIEEELRNFLNKNEEPKNIIEQIDDSKEELIQFDDEPPLEKVLKPISLKMLPKQQVYDSIQNEKSHSEEPLNEKGSEDRQNKFADLESIKKQMQMVENNISANIKNFEDVKRNNSNQPKSPQQIIKIHKDKLQPVDRESLILRKSSSSNLDVVENSQIFKTPELSQHNNSEIKSQLLINQSAISQQLEIKSLADLNSQYKEFSEFQKEDVDDKINIQQEQQQNQQIKSFEEYKEKQNSIEKQEDINIERQIEYQENQEKEKKEEKINQIDDDLENTKQIQERLKKVDQIRITFNPIEQQKESVDEYPVTRESINLNQSLPQQQEKPFECFSQFINKDQTEMSIIEESRMESENKQEKMQRLKQNVKLIFIIIRKSLRYSNLIQCHIKSIMNEMEEMQKLLTEIENNEDFELRNEVRKNVETDLTIMQQSMDVVNQKSRVCLKPATQYFGKSVSQFQPSQTGQSQILNENDIKKMIMDCSKDIFDNYSQMLLNQIKSQMK